MQLGHLRAGRRRRVELRVEEGPIPLVGWARNGDRQSVRPIRACDKIEAPANGAVYSPGQVVYARWSCKLVDPVVGTLVQNCAGTVAPGHPISTTLGKHTFTVKGIKQNLQEPIRVTVTYTVKSH